MKTSQFIPLLTMLPSVCFSQQNQQKQEPTERPNVIFILSDDHTSQSIGAYGSIYKEICPTPNIDRIANEGALFTNAFCTNSISGPSRACILTGKYAHLNGFYKNESAPPFDSTQITFPRMLHDNGYTTAMVGKWHLGTTPVGFDYFKYHSLAGGQGIYWNPVWNENGKKTPEKGYATTLTANAAMKWLESGRDKSKPFCLLYHFKAPHRPWDPDSCYQHIFDNVEMPYPETFNDNYSTRELTAGDTEMTISSHLTRRDLKMAPPEGLSPKERQKWLNAGQNGEPWSPSDSLKGLELKKWKYQRYVKDYLACTKSVDDQVGRLLKYLKDSGLDENTIVVYCGDQGFFLGEHGFFDKRWMYEESLHMPFIVKYPAKIKPGTVIDDFITNVDFAPTILDMCGVRPDKEMQGKCYANTMSGKETKPLRTSMYYHYYEFPFWHHVQPHYGVRTDRYKLIHFYYTIDKWELYDLEKDPNELNNVYGKPAYAKVQNDLIKELKRQQIECKDTGTLDDFRKITKEAYKRNKN